MSFVGEFKQFINRGSVVDMAVGIIVGASFTKIVDSLVGDVLMPIVGFFLGGVDFSYLEISLNNPLTSKPPVKLALGKFINSSVDFFIVAISVFFIVKALSWAKDHSQKKK